MKYLEHLRQQGAEKKKATGALPTELTKLGSDGFGGGGIPCVGNSDSALRAQEQALNAPLERRRARVVRQLQEHSELLVAFDACNAPLKTEPGEPVSVVIAVRTEAAGIISAEFSVPRERFDFVLFSKMLDETARRPS